MQNAFQNYWSAIIAMHNNWIDECFYQDFFAKGNVIRHQLSVWKAENFEK